LRNPEEAAPTKCFHVQEAISHGYSFMSLLVTSFAPWKAHQASNASDDLVALMQARRYLPTNTIVMRQLPVHFQLAPCQVLSAMLKQRPSVVVCCGMAEQRSLLTLERYAHQQQQRLETSLDVQHLCQFTQWTTVSHDAGSYVCNDLYFQLLTYIQKYRLPMHGLFVHVPPLHPYNQDAIVHDFATVLSHLAAVGGRPEVSRAA
jgi:pyroglutamyl-peptidase